MDKILWEHGKPNLRTSPPTGKASQLPVLHMTEPRDLFFGDTQPKYSQIQGHQEKLSVRLTYYTEVERLNKIYKFNDKLTPISNTYREGKKSRRGRAGHKGEGEETTPGTQSIKSTDLQLPERSARDSFLMKPNDT